ncbi:S-adenosyl-L-methionine-dependent methyltransferase [Astrocystis sublimbata]|nr:S-adenosyl-L-methionine-dependent methyltransferase [Astrocystis sublimbata]
MSTTPYYVMTRDYIDNNRINLQHYLTCGIFGYLTHPNIPLKDFPADARIADIGTGTGIWLSDLATRVPATTQLDGLDVSFDAAPPTSLIAPNVTFRRWDIKSPVPEEMAGKYDLVHVRHFSFVLQDGEMDGVYANLLKLLKPGGYLQWTEPDVATFRVEKPVTASSDDDGGSVMIQLVAASQTQDNRLKPTWVPRMPELFTASGLVNVVADKREAPADLGLAMHECNLSLHPIIARQTQNKEVAQRVEELMPEVCRQTRKGFYLAFTRWTVVGQKAVSR